MLAFQLFSQICHQKGRRNLSLDFELFFLRNLRPERKEIISRVFAILKSLILEKNEVIAKFLSILKDVKPESREPSAQFLAILTSLKGLNLLATSS